MATDGIRPDDKGDEGSINIQASEEAVRPVYSDLARVRHDPEGFMIDFYMVEPDNKEMGWLTARVRMGHRMAIRLSQALSKNIEKWAAKEIKVRTAEADLLQGLAEGSDSDEIFNLLEALTVDQADKDGRQLGANEDQAKEA